MAATKEATIALAVGLAVGALSGYFATRPEAERLAEQVRSLEAIVEVSDQQLRECRAELLACLTK